MEQNKQTTQNQNSTPNQNPQGGFRGGRGGGGKGGFGGRGGGFRGRRPNNAERPEYEQKVLDIARVTRVTKGGKRFSFRTTIIIGDGRSKVGMGIGKGIDVAQSVQKAYNRAKKNMMSVVLVNGTIPYQVQAKYNSAIILLKPAVGGVKAGGAVRVVAKLGGIKSLTGKLLGRTNNKINIAMATFKALGMIRPLKKDVIKSAKPADKPAEAPAVTN